MQKLLLFIWIFNHTFVHRCEYSWLFIYIPSILIVTRYDTGGIPMIFLIYNTTVLNIWAMKYMFNTECLKCISYFNHYLTYVVILYRNCYCIYTPACGKWSSGFPWWKQAYITRATNLAFVSSSACATAIPILRPRTIFVPLLWSWTTISLVGI